MKKGLHFPHLVMLLTQDLNSPSGLGRYFPLAKYLVRHNYHVTILALHSNFDAEKNRDFWDQGVHIKYVSQMHVQKIHDRTQYFPVTKLIKVVINATKRLMQEAMKESPDLVLVGKPHPMNGIAGLKVARNKSVPLIVDCDDYEAESNKTNSIWQKYVLKYFEDSLPKMADLVTTNTYFNKDRMQKLGIEEKRIYYLPNGVDTDRFQFASVDRLKSLRDSLGLGNNKVVGYFGSINLANHPVDLLVRSFARIYKNDERVRLLIVGGGGDMERLRALVKVLNIESGVVFTGRVDPNEIGVYYQLADVSVDPVNDTLADRGRCPLKIFESWQMGVPVISGHVGDRKKLGGVPAAISLYKPGDEAQLSQLLIELIKDVNELSNLRTQGLLRVENYSWERIVNCSITIFRELFERDR